MPGSWWSCIDSQSTDQAEHHVSKSGIINARKKGLMGEQADACEKDVKLAEAVEKGTHSTGSGGGGRARSWSFSAQRSCRAEEAGCQGSLRDTGSGGELAMEQSTQSMKYAKNKRRSSKAGGAKHSGLKAMLAAARNPSTILRWYSGSALPESGEEPSSTSASMADDSPAKCHSAESSTSLADSSADLRPRAMKQIEVLFTPEKPTGKASKDVQLQEAPVQGKEAAETKEDAASRRTSRNSTQPNIARRIGVPMIAVDDTTKIRKDLYMELLRAADKIRDMGQHVIVEAEQSPDKRAHLLLYQDMCRV
eukprot:TRINITY_DN23391_c0_g1_i1.p1 TRINITY_DN23391_c0_g1~~TRINITY_DN23391_c0_g1_i1.p1  ORF type:complete len:324 (+),score=58.44 TRINITY_DN23391_c0_g1_i1:50-973(+)